MLNTTSNGLTFEAVKALRELTDSQMTAIVLSLAYKHPIIFNELVATLNVTPGSVVIEYRTNAYDSYTQTFHLSAESFNRIRGFGTMQKIAAIKEFRNETNAGLKEAKDIIEWLAYNNYIPNYLKGSDDYRPQWTAYMKLVSNT